MSKPRLLLDENIGHGVAIRLRSHGFDVASILDIGPAGMTDHIVLKQALNEGRILVTLDKDFGTLIFRDSQRHLGVIFLRLRQETQENIFQVLNQVLSRYSIVLGGKFVTVSETSIRFRA